MVEPLLLLGPTWGDGVAESFSSLHPEISFEPVGHTLGEHIWSLMQQLRKECAPSASSQKL